MGKSEDENPCFGGPLYDPASVECSGGYDPSYVDEDASPKERHLRPRCELFEACGAQVRAKRYAEASRRNARIVPPIAATPRPEPLSPARIYASQPAVDAQAQKIAELKNKIAWLEGQTISPPVQQPQALTPVMPQQLPPAQMLPVNYGMTSYLSVLEPGRRKKGKKWRSLASETARSIFKASGHSFSYFFDTVPWGEEDK